MVHDPPKITLDTNGVINLLDQTAPARASFEALTDLFRLVLSGHAELAITTRVEDDMLGDRNEARRAAMLAQLKLFPIISTVARWDVSKWNSEAVYAGDPLFIDIQRIIFPGLQEADKRYRNKRNDIDHLVGHRLNQRDIFVTDDKDILKRYAELKSGPGLVVMSPGQCAAYIGALANPPAKAIPMDGLNAQYHAPRTQGRVTFDYSNNNGEYIIGIAEYMFRTKWSKASDTSIHAYKDGRGIAGVALIRAVKSFKQIGAADKYDYSSRTRSPATGQIVIWRNDNGMYAATRIVAIKDDTRNDERDELVFDYVILLSGNDFSKHRLNRWTQTMNRAPDND